jgi:hypothetical protein
MPRLSFWLAFCIFAFPAAVQALGDSNRQGQLTNPGQRIVTGTVESVSSDRITVKTDEGKTHIFTVSGIERSDYATKGLQSRDRIILSFDRKDRLIGIDKIDEGIPYNKDLWLIGNTR